MKTSQIPVVICGSCLSLCSLVLLPSCTVVLLYSSGLLLWFLFVLVLAEASCVVSLPAILMVGPILDMLDSTIFSPRGILQQFLITSLVDTPLLVLKPNLAPWLCIKEPAMLANCRLIISLTVPRNRVLPHGCARCFLWLCLEELVTSNLLALSQTLFNYSRSHD